MTAARLLATAALHDGKYATACPFYGAERRGAPVVSFVRIDKHPIKIYSQIRTPDMIVVLDESVMDTVDVMQGLRSGGRVFINSPHPHGSSGFTTYTTDLTGIALREDLVVAGSPILNTPVLGALAKIGIVSAGSVTTAIRGMFADGRNARVAAAAYAETKL